MVQTTILLVGYKKSRSDPFITALQKRYDVFVVPSGKKGLALAEKHPPHVVILDSIAMRTAGERLCRKLSRALHRAPLVYIHPGPRDEVNQCDADVLLIPPFTPRKLTNAIDRLLQASDDEVITWGPFSVNVVRRTLIAHGSETQLTPKQALLVETFLRHPGETLERKQLMESVWDTAYMGDTRTLDVHIRWIRKAMEVNGHPRYLMTVRGVGYRLDFPDDADGT